MKSFVHLFLEEVVSACVAKKFVYLCILLGLYMSFKYSMEIKIGRIFLLSLQPQLTTWLPLWLFWAL